MDNLTGKRIREKRIELGLSQDELAKKLNVNRTTVAKWESGDNNLKQSKVVSIAKALDCSPTWLIGLNEDEMEFVNKEQILKNITSYMDRFNAYYQSVSAIELLKKCSLTEIEGYIANLSLNDINRLAAYIDYIKIKKENEE